MPFKPSKSSPFVRGTATGQNTMAKCISAQSQVWELKLHPLQDQIAGSKSEESHAKNAQQALGPRVISTWRARKGAVDTRRTA